MGTISGPVTRTDLINFYIRERGYKSFLELGTLLGENHTQVVCEKKVGVDSGDYPFKQTYKMTTDEFFAQNEETFDVIFIDACHEHSFVHRDICNALKCLNDGGVILCHDCSPPHAQYEGPEHCWTAWRAFVQHRVVSSFLMFCYDSDYGVGILDTTQLAPDEQHIRLRPLTYDYLNQNRKLLLGLVEEITL